MSVFFTRRGEPPKFNKVASDFAVGDSIFLNFNGKPTEFLIVHQGNPDSTMYDESCNGVWLLLKDCYIQQLWDNSTINKYEKSHVHKYLNNDFLAMFDAKTQGVIKQVKIPYISDIGQKIVSTGASGLSTKIFLPSVYEVGITSKGSSYAPLIDGKTLSYFYESDDTPAKRVAYYNGESSYWWLRTSYISTTSYSLTVSNKGNLGSYVVTTSFGIRPMLIVPSDTKFDPETNTII